MAGHGNMPGDPYFGGAQGHMGYAHMMAGGHKVYNFVYVDK